MIFLGGVLGTRSPGKMMAFDHAKGDLYLGKMRPFRRGRYFDKVSPLTFMYGCVIAFLI